MPRYIDVDAFRAEYELREHCDECGRYGKKDCDYPSYSARDFCGWLDDAPVIEAVHVHDISVWLAAYAAPPQYAIDEIAGTDPGRLVTTDTLVKAWEYHWKNLMECGLIGEGLDADRP